MMSHVGAMTAFALCVSVVFAVLMRDAPAEQWALGLRLFVGLVGGGLLAGWLLYPMPF